MFNFEVCVLYSIIYEKFQESPRKVYPEHILAKQITAEKKQETPDDQIALQVLRDQITRDKVGLKFSILIPSSPRSVVDLINKSGSWTNHYTSPVLRNRLPSITVLRV